MEEYICYFCDQVFDEKRGLSHHLYSHLTRGDIAPKENDQVIPDTNIDNIRDNEAVGKFLDVDNNFGNGSKGSMDSSSVKRKRKRRCKSCNSTKHRSQKEKTHGIANLESRNSENEELPDD